MKKAPFPAKEKVLFNITKKHYNTLISLCKSNITSNQFAYKIICIIDDIAIFLIVVILAIFCCYFLSNAVFGEVLGGAK
jgi:hypothetical protein